MYEIWSVGHKPFEDLTNNKVKLELHEAHVPRANISASVK